MGTFDYVIVGIVVTIIAVVAIINIKRNSDVRKNGIRTSAVISRVRDNDTVDSDGAVSTTHTYFVEYKNQSGETIEAVLGNILDKYYKVGDQVEIMYLPEKENYAVVVK